jgi:hypothetical protein
MVGRQPMKLRHYNKHWFYSNKIENTMTPDQQKQALFLAIQGNHKDLISRLLKKHDNLTIGSADVGGINAYFVGLNTRLIPSMSNINIGVYIKNSLEILKIIL